MYIYMPIPKFWAKLSNLVLKLLKTNCDHPMSAHFVVLSKVSELLCVNAVEHQWLPSHLSSLLFRSALSSSPHFSSSKPASNNRPSFISQEKRSRLWRSSLLWRKLSFNYSHLKSACLGGVHDSILARPVQPVLLKQTKITMERHSTK